LQEYKVTIPTFLFYASLLVSLVLLVVLSPFRGPVYVSDILVELAYAADPLLIHLVSLILVIWLVVRLIRRGSPKSPSRNHTLLMANELFVPALSIALAGVDVLLGDYFAKLFFGLPVPLDRLPEPWLTRFIESLFGTIPDPLSSAPSSFVYRESLLVLAGLFVLAQTQVGLSWNKKLAVGSFFAFLLVLMGVVRVAVVAHTPIDVAVGVAVATIVFWSLVSAWVHIFQQKVDIEYWQGYLLATLTIGLFMLLVSRNTGVVLLLIFLYVSVAGIGPIAAKLLRGFLGRPHREGQ